MSTRPRRPRVRWTPAPSQLTENVPLCGSTGPVSLTCATDAEPSRNVVQAPRVQRIGWRGASPGLNAVPETLRSRNVRWNEITSEVCAASGAARVSTKSRAFAIRKFTARECATVLPGREGPHPALRATLSRRGSKTLLPARRGEGAARGDGGAWGGAAAVPAPPAHAPRG